MATGPIAQQVRRYSAVLTRAAGRHRSHDAAESGAPL